MCGRDGASKRLGVFLVRFKADLMLFIPTEWKFPAGKEAEQREPSQTDRLLFSVHSDPEGPKSP